MFLNIQSIRDKTLELDIVLNEINNDIICISEHWLKPEETDFYQLKNYHLATSYVRGNMVHGGSAIYVKNGLPYKVIDVSSFCGTQHLEVAAIKLECNIVVVSVYRSTNGDVQIFLNEFEKLLDLLSRKSTLRLVLGGDYNVDLVAEYTKPIQREFTRLIRQYNLHFTNYTPTRGKAVLDNVLTDLKHGTYQTSVREFGLSDHAAVIFDIDPVITDTLPINNKNNHTSITYNRPVTKTGLDNYVQYLSNVDWSVLTLGRDAEETYNLFFNQIEQGFNECFPLVKKRHSKFSRPKTNSLNWYNEDLRKSRQNLLALHDRHKALNTPASHSALIRYRKKYKQELKTAKKQYVADCIDNSDNKCKAAWEAIRKETTNSHQPCIPVEPNDFNEFFINSVLDVAEQSGSNPSAAAELLKAKVVSASDLVWKTVSCEEVVQHVKFMKSSKSRDVYGLSSDVLKSILPVILEPLTFCINHCLIEGMFPSKLKLSKVVPIFKKGCRDIPASYRPISLVPIFSKVLERIIHNQLYSFFETNSLFSSSQYGFRAGKSTIQAVSHLVNVIYENFEMKIDTGVTLCDLSKAFDCVCHETLLTKLEFYGIKGTSLSLLRSYLENREQIVSVNNQLSDKCRVSCGVPQGSVLGPLLFLIMVNDIDVNVPCNTLCFADDTTLFNSSQNVDTINIASKNALNSVSEWFSINGFVLNNNKTQTIVFSNKNIKASESNICDQLSNVKLLGIVLDSKLTWHNHTDFICNKLSRVVYLLRSLNRNVPKSYLRLAYNSFFQGILLYGICLWGNSAGAQDVLLVQKKAVRIVAGADYRDHCRPIFICENILTVFSLYVLYVLLDVKKECAQLSKRFDVHDHNTRSKSNVEIPFCRLVKVAKSSKVIGLKLYNKLPVKIRNIEPLAQFKLALTNGLLKHPLYSVNEFFHFSDSEFKDFK